MDDPTAYGLRATVEDGAVLIDGAGVALTQKAKAAEDLGEQLHAAVIVALAPRAAESPQAPTLPKTQRRFPTHAVPINVHDHRDRASISSCSVASIGV